MDKPEESEDVMFKFRSHWCDAIEQILECPVCLDILKGKIFQCVKGHDVCQYCKKTLDVCPVCKAVFSESRNYTVEKLIEKFEDIKLSLLEPENDINKHVVFCTKTVETQTTETGDGVAIVRRSSRIANRAKGNNEMAAKG